MDLMFANWGKWWHNILQERKYGKNASQVLTKPYFNGLSQMYEWNLIGFCLQWCVTNSVVPETDILRWNRRIIRGIVDSHWGNVSEYIQTKSSNTQILTYAQENEKENFYIFQILKLVVKNHCEGPTHARQSYLTYKSSFDGACPWPSISLLLQILCDHIPQNRLGLSE